MLFNTTWTYTNLRVTFPYGGSPDVYQSGLTIETKNYCGCDELYMQCFVPEPRNSKGSFQAVVISGSRLQDSRIYAGW